MRFRDALRATGKEWLIALMCYSLVIAPFGCEIQSSLLEDLGGLLPDGGSTAGSDGGLFINDDYSSPLVAAAQGEGGRGFFVFGKRGADGSLLEVDAITARAADGRDAFMSFVLGRPVHVQGLDGSYAHVTYTEIGGVRLSATVDIYDAGSGGQEQHVIEVDLAKAAQEVATLIEREIGQHVPVTDADQLQRAKPTTNAAQITIFSPLFALFVLPLVALVNLTTVILGQLITSLVAILVMTAQIIVASIFFPFFLVAELLNATVFNVHVEAPALRFTFLPDPPTFVLKL